MSETCETLQAVCSEAAHAYGLAGNKAVKRVLKKFFESPGGVSKMMKLVDRVEFEKWQRTKAEAEDAEAHGEATPVAVQAPSKAWSRSWWFLQLSSRFGLLLALA